MKAAWLVASLLLVGGLAGCISVNSALDDAGADDAPDFQTNETSVDLPDVITGIEHLAASDVPSGAGIWLHGDYAYVGSRDLGLHVVDVSDPANPTLVGELADTYARDVDLLTYKDGRLVAVLAGQAQGIHFVDVTDPETPTLLSTVETADMGGSGAHNVAVIPNTTLVYNSGSGGYGDDIDVIDASNPHEPEILTSWGTHGCHDITFYMNDAEEKYRAYCAGIEETQIWDITDPLDGKLIAAVTNPFVSALGATAGQQGSLTPGLHHLAIVNEDASLLIVGDEYTGGLGPGCGAHVSGGPDTPLGALWFYDITDEANPQELGHLSPTVPVEEHASGTTGCTAHFGQLVPDHDLLAISWYAAGVLLVDFSDPTEPSIVDQWNQGANTWDVRYHNGHLFTGDINRGLDVLAFQ